MSALIDQLLGQSPLFKHLGAGWHARLKQAGEARQFSAGQMIIEEGSASSRLHLVVAGRVRVWTQAAGRVVELETLSRDDYFGEVSLLSGKKATANVEAASETVELFSIARPILLELVDEDEKLRHMLEGVTLARARDTITKVLK